MNVVLLCCFIFNICIIFRNELTFRYRGYWIDKVFEYRIRYDDKYINYEDIMNYYKFVFKLFAFNKDAMIEDKDKLEILKNMK